MSKRLCRLPQCFFGLARILGLEFWFPALCPARYSAPAPRPSWLSIEPGSGSTSSCLSVLEVSHNIVTPEYIFPAGFITRRRHLLCDQGTQRARLPASGQAGHLAPGSTVPGWSHATSVGLDPTGATVGASYIVVPQLNRVGRESPGGWECKTLSRDSGPNFR